jgi:DNA-binding Xre family transcriptional regulator
MLAGGRQVVWTGGFSLMDRLLERWVDEYRNDPEFIAEGMALVVAESVLLWLEKNDKDQAWLAAELGFSMSRVKRLFNASANMRLVTIARLAVALSVTPESLVFPRYLDETTTSPPHDPTG